MGDLVELLARARAAFKAGKAQEAAGLFAAAQGLAPRDPEIPHERGLALLESGDVGLAARAQTEALALDPDHVGARAQRAAALEALGDDAGAAADLRELLRRLGPQPALSARQLGLEASAKRAAALRLVGASPFRLAHSPLIGTALSRDPADPLRFTSPFAELRASVREGAVARLELVFENMDASLARSDVSYGGSTEDEHGRRVPLDEFSAAAIVFLAECLGIEPLRARRLLAFLLQPECGLGPHRVAAVDVGWSLTGDDGDRKYGLYCQA